MVSDRVSLDLVAFTSLIDDHCLRLEIWRLRSSCLRK